MQWRHRLRLYPHFGQTLGGRVALFGGVSGTNAAGDPAGQRGQVDGLDRPSGRRLDRQPALVSISMAFREMKAHVGGIAGSSLLIGLTPTAGWLMRGVRNVVGDDSINLETLSRIRSTRKEPPDSTTTRQSALDVDWPTPDTERAHWERP